MRLLIFITLQTIVLALGAVALWWLVDPESFAIAAADSVIAGAVAVQAELFAIRQGWW